MRCSRVIRKLQVQTPLFLFLIAVDPLTWSLMYYTSYILFETNVYYSVIVFLCDLWCFVSKKLYPARSRNITPTQRRFGNAIRTYVQDEDWRYLAPWRRIVHECIPRCREDDLVGSGIFYMYIMTYFIYHICCCSKSRGKYINK